MRRVVLHLAAWFVAAPPMFGGLAAAYEIAAFRLVSFQPELPPLHVVVVELICACLAGAATARIMVAFIRSRSWRARPGSSSSIWSERLLAAALAAVLFLAAGWRTLVVEGAIVQQFGFCCCCESKPSWQHTVNAVFNPSRF
jgi:hypothetical protein